jgi:hypothetical protein
MNWLASIQKVVQVLFLGLPWKKIGENFALTIENGNPLIFGLASG